MPLSEDEERILAEIEQQFNREDPEFAQRVKTTSLYRHAARNVKWAGLGLLASLIFTLVVFSHLVLGAIGFVLMVVCFFFLFLNLRKMGRVGYEALTTQVRGRRERFRDKFGNMGKRMRGRFERPGDD